MNLEAVYNPSVAERKGSDEAASSPLSTIPETAGDGKYNLVEHNHYFAIFRAPPNYEVVSIRFYSKHHNLAPGQFRYPASSEFGKHGWSARSLEYAREILRDETLKNLKRKKQRNCSSNPEPEIAPVIHKDPEI